MAIIENFDWVYGDLLPYQIKDLVGDFLVKA